MGNSVGDSFTDEKLKGIIESNYQFRGDVNDERFGKVSIYNHKHDPHQQIMFKQRWTNTSEESSQLHSYIQSRRAIKSPHLTTLPYYEMVDDRQMFNTFTRHSIAFEYFPKTLEQELEHRAQIRESPNDTIISSVKYYSESEVWYIINSLLSVVSTFKDHDYPHGDIQPKNIFIDNEGKIKIMDNLLINYGDTGYRKMIFEPGYRTPLSPQLLRALPAKVLNPAHDKVKSDVWAIGITALCACNNTNFNKYYDWRNYQINYVDPRNPMMMDNTLDPSMMLKSNVQGKTAPQNPRSGVVNINAIGNDLNNMRHLGYSEELINTVEAMLSTEEHNRPDSDFLLHHLNNRVVEESRVGGDPQIYQPHRVPDNSGGDTVDFNDIQAQEDPLYGDQHDISGGQGGIEFGDW